MSECPDCGMRDDDWFLCHRDKCAVKAPSDDLATIARLQEQAERWCDKYLAALRRAEVAEAKRDRLREALQAMLSNPDKVSRAQARAALQKEHQP